MVNLLSLLIAKSAICCSITCPIIVSPSRAGPAPGERIAFIHLLLYYFAIIELPRIIEDRWVELWVRRQAIHQTLRVCVQQPRIVLPLDWH